MTLFNYCRFDACLRFHKYNSHQLKIRWEPPLTRYSVGALGYGQTLDISPARQDLGYAPNTDVLARLRECGPTFLPL